MDRLEPSAETAALLTKYGFDERVFQTLQHRLKMGESIESFNKTNGLVGLPPSHAISSLVALNSPEHREYSRAGRDMVAKGRLGVLMLAGGMATRFGGGVKALAEVAGSLTFIEAKLRDAARVAEQANAKLSVFLMTSFTTHQVICKWLESWRSPFVDVVPFVQSVSVRLTPEGNVFCDATGAPSLYSTGHGDVPFSFERSGLLGAFVKKGGQVLMVSNIDNIAATIDPAIVGMHAGGGATISVEVVDKYRGDKGGAPATIEGKTQIVEAFRFPKDFDQDQIPVFNTNTLYINVEVLKNPGALTWFAATKSVDARVCVQFERLIGELTAFHSSAYIRVPREGELSRFEPIKEASDVAARRDQLEKVLKARGIH